MTTDDFLLSSYDFTLPMAQIAQYPAPQRDESRLLVYTPPTTTHTIFKRLPDFLQRGDLLIRNNTKVIPARLLGKRATGGKVEVLLVHPAAPTEPGIVNWVCLAKPTKNLKISEGITFGGGALRGVLEEKRENGQVLFSFAAADVSVFMQRVNQCGVLPLPPYITRPAAPADRERYQTIYAKIIGAVAAPTAGLHFTEPVLARLASKRIETAEITLHVGPGTFKPMHTNDISAHQMDSEYYEISPSAADAINRARREHRRIIAIGTTSARALESAAARFGTGEILPGGEWTRLFIRPDYQWQIVDGLLTNFHLPRSTLLVLVSTLIGREETLALYADAAQRGYRFYSYGDACLLWRRPSTISIVS